MLRSARLRCTTLVRLQMPTLYMHNLDMLTAILPVVLSLKHLPIAIAATTCLLEMIFDVHWCL